MSSIPKPEPGLVISYRYLWRYESDKGQLEGRKGRPSVLVLAAEEQDSKVLVTVVPITHSNPTKDLSAIEIPAAVKKHLGLDSSPSWIIVDEVNQFVWPGFDLCMIPGSKGQYDYGFIPPKLFERVKSALLGEFSRQRVKVSNRD